MICDEMIILRDTEVSETDAENNETTPSEEHGVELQFDALTDSAYAGDDLLNGYDVELFSADAATAEIDHEIRDNNQNTDIQNEYFVMPEEEQLSVAEEINRQLNGQALFDESQSQLKYSSAPREKGVGIVWSAVLVAGAVLLGILAAVLWRKIRRKVRADI